MFRNYRMKISGPYQPSLKDLGEHKKIFEAIKARDVKKAERAITEHLKTSQ
jgi:DNA-binding GntR family transcriptional regulator